MTDKTENGRTTRDIVLLNGRTADRDRARIVVRDGRIASIDDGDGDTSHQDMESIDLGGRLVVPGFTDGHLHLDKTLLGMEWRPHRAGPTVRDRVEAEKEMRRHLEVPVRERAGHLLELALSLGTTSIRTHVDIDDFTRLDNLAEVLDLRRQWADRIDIQVVAFPQSGIKACPPVASLLAEALEMGADLIGGLDPAGFDGDEAAHLHTVFALAERYSRGIDIHLHDGGEIGLRQIRDIAARTRALGLQRKVTVSHAFALADADVGELSATAERMREAGVSVLSSIPGMRCPPIERLTELGVEVFFGTDNVRDAWNPATIVGMVDRMALAAHHFGMRTDERLAGLVRHVTSIPKQVTGLGIVDIAVSEPADLAVFDARHLPQVIVERARPAMVFKGGRQVVG